MRSARNSPTWVSRSPFRDPRLSKGFVRRRPRPPRGGGDGAGTCSARDRRLHHNAKRAAAAPPVGKGGYMATEAHHLSPDELIARIDDWKGKRHPLRGARRRHHQPQLHRVGEWWVEQPGRRQVRAARPRRRYRHVHRPRHRARVHDRGGQDRHGSPCRLHHRAREGHGHRLHRRRGHAPRHDGRAPGAHQAGRRVGPCVSRQGGLQQQDRDLRHAAPVHEGGAGHRRPHAGAARGAARADARDRGGRRAGCRARRRVPERPAARRTSSSTPTAGCGSSTGSTAA